MKNLYKLFMVAACAGSMTLGSCIQETVPTSTITDDVLKSSSKASEALVWAMPASFNSLATYSSDFHYDWGYGSIMHIRDVMTADQCVVSSGYNWYTSWSEDNMLGPRYVSSFFLWAYYWKAISNTNNAIGALKGSELGTLGVAHAFRALFYLDAARMYEYLPNNAHDNKNEDGVDVSYLTMPIVTEDTPESVATNNPRATHEEMYKFILSDLKEAERLIVKYNRSNKTVPDLACVYGLQARLYMWNAGYLEETGKTAEAAAEYTNAKNAARNAINNHAGSPTTQDQWLSTTNGFNTLSIPSWMWGSSTTADDDVVQTGIVNWASWMCNEATFGYAAAEPFTMIGSDLYDKISDEDFRKLSFIAPAGSPLAGQEPLIVSDPNDPSYMRGDFPDYTAIKFRPGSGDVKEPKVGAACAFPVMRVEEMYLTEAEAAAHVDPAEGASLLNTFMQSYRYASYNCVKSTVQSVVDEVFLQKRIELWGEGLLFFDYKRLNKSVDRTVNSNCAATERFKTDGRPMWMNFCISSNETQNNKALTTQNNPDPSNAYVAQ